MRKKGNSQDYGMYNTEGIITVVVDNKFLVTEAALQSVLFFAYLCYSLDLFWMGFFVRVWESKERITVSTSVQTRHDKDSTQYKEFKKQ